MGRSSSAIIPLKNDKWINIGIDFKGEGKDMASFILNAFSTIDLDVQWVKEYE